MFALTDILSKWVEILVLKDEGHQHPECICAKILHKMELVSENNEIGSD